MDREDSAAGIVHNRLERHAKVTFKSEIDGYKSMRKMLEAGESEYSAVLKTHKLLTSRGARNAENGEIAANWERI
jgi:hypothetical protein